MRIRREQVDKLRDAGLDRFRRERLFDLRQRGFHVDEDTTTGAVTVRDAAGGSARVVSQGRRCSVTTAERRTTLIEQHEQGRIQKIVDAGGHEVRLERNRDGLLTAIDRGHGSRYQFEVTPDDRLLKLTYPDGTVTQTEYDQSGRPTIVTDRNGGQIQYEYDADLQTGVVDARGHRTRVIYDGWDMPSAIEYADGLRQEFEFSSDGRLEAMRVNGRLHARYEYDETGGTYDVKYVDGTFVHVVLDGDRVREATNETGTVQFEYDAGGRLIAERTDGRAVRYVRNEVGAIVAIHTPTQDTIRFERDRDQRLCGIIDWSGGRYVVSNGPVGPPTEIKYPNGVVLTTPLTPLGLHDAWVLTGPGFAGTVDRCEFTYDACDRLTSVVRGIESRSYRYDGSGRLIAAETPVRELAEQFELDANGNRLRDQAGESVYDAANRLLRCGSASFSYDDLGNTTSMPSERGVNSFVWNGRGQLIEVRTQNRSARYAYDAIGRRIRKETDDGVTEYVWAGTQLLSETTTAGDRVQRRDYLICPDRHSAPLAMRDGSAVFYLHAGRLGEVLCTTDGRGDVVWKADYTAFGRAVVSLERVRQPWRYAGQYFDDETGLHYVVARYYAPQFGRFLSRDPLLAEGGSLNFYTYCDGDPLNRIDLVGQIGAFLTGVLVGAAVGAVVGAAIGAGIEMYRQRNQEQYDWGKIGKSALIGGAIGLIGGAVGAAVEGAAIAAMGVVAAGAVAGGVGAGIEYCAEVALTDATWSWAELGTSVGIGTGIGAVTAGVGGIIAARAARRAAREAAKEAAEKAGRVTARQVAKKPSSGVKFSRKQVQKKFKHADDFGVEGDYNPRSAAEFEGKLRDHIDSPDTIAIDGEYRGQPVTHYIDPKTGKNVIVDSSGNYHSSWRLNPVQEKHVLSTGKLGGG
jgi:RHS repeat-associated protein